LNDSGVVVTPAPMMYRPDSRRRMASGVKSLSLDSRCRSTRIVVQQIHGSDDHGDVGRVFAGNVVKQLLARMARRLSSGSQFFSESLRQLP